LRRFSRPRRSNSASKSLLIRSIITAICAATFVGGAFAYGVDVRKSLDEPCASTFVQINSLMFRMRQPDGVERLFIRNRDDPSRLHSTTPPWVGAIRPDRRMANIFTDATFKGEKTEFCFVEGALRFLSVGKKDYEFSPADMPVCTNDVASLWPAAELTDWEKAQNDMWKGGGRLRIFSNNPNRTALIFVELGILALALALFGRTVIWRVHGTVWTLVFIVLQVQAASRGGFLAFLVGSAILLSIRLRRGASRRFLAMTAALVVVCVLLPFLFKAGERTSGSKTMSIPSRMAIWKEMPRMLKAAPWGWGLWKSGPAYNAWFEKPCNMHMIGDLFNDHFSRIVEGGIVCGGAYVLGWSLLILFGIRVAWRGGSPIPLAVWSSYFVASSFNPMNYWGPSFVVPVMASGLYFRGPFSVFRPHHRRDDAKVIGLALVVTFLALALVGVVAVSSPAQDVPLRVGWLGKCVIVGEGEPKVWLVDDGYVLSGDYYGFPGKELRAYYRKHANAEPLGIVADLHDVPEDVDRLVVTGKWCVPYVQAMRPMAKHVILLTPPFGSDTIPQNLVDSADLHVLTGEYVARLTGDDKVRNPMVHVCPGAEAYVPGWLDVVLRKR